MRLYVYCVCEPLGAGGVAGERGCDGAEVREVACGEGLAALVSEFAAEGPAGVTPERVRAHNRVSALALSRTTPLPFRFGTLLSEARLAEYVAANAPALREALARVAGCVEMGVKIMHGAGVDERAAGRDEAVRGDDGRDDEASSSSSSAPSSTSQSSSSSPPGAGRGTAFLLAKRREILGGEAARARAAETAALLEGRVEDVVRDARVTLLPSRALLLRAAHLVERGRLAEYRERVRALEAERAPRLRFLTSGPWAPYSFSAISSR